MIIQVNKVNLEYNYKYLGGEYVVLSPISINTTPTLVLNENKNRRTILFQNTGT